MIGFLISAAVPFSWVLIVEQIPQKLIFLTLDATTEKLMKKHYPIKTKSLKAKRKRKRINRYQSKKIRD